MKMSWSNTDRSRTLLQGWVLLMTIVSTFARESFVSQQDGQRIVRESLQDTNHQLHGLAPHYPIPNIPEERQPYHVTAWENDPADFYHLFSFNALGGNRYDLNVHGVSEHKRMSHSSPIIDMAIAEVSGIRVIASASAEKVSLQWNIQGQEITQHYRDVNGTISMELASIRNPYTGQTEMYLFLIQNYNGQTLTIFKLSLDKPNIYLVGQVRKDPNIVAVRHVANLVSNTHFLFLIRPSTNSPVCVSEVMRLDFHARDGIIIYPVQPLKSLGSVEAKPFTINGVTYVAIANSLCKESYIFVYDTDTGRFHLHQPLRIRNATSFEYFQIGYRHFLAGIGFDEATIFEWEGEGMIKFQSLPIKAALPSSGPDQRRWKSVKLTYDNQALLILTEPYENLKLYSWINGENRFSIINPPCMSWMRNDNITGRNAYEFPSSATSLRQAQLNCLWLQDQCIGINEIHSSTVTKYVYESNSTNLRQASQPGSVFWAKEKSGGFGCMSITSTNIIRSRMVSYSEQGVPYVMVTSQQFTTVFYFMIEKISEDQISKLDSLEQRLKLLKNSLNQLTTRAENLLKRGRGEREMTKSTNQTIRAKMTIKKVIANKELKIQSLNYTKTVGNPNLGPYNTSMNELANLHHTILDLLDASISIDKPKEVQNLIRFTNAQSDKKLTSTNAEIRNFNYQNIPDFINNAVTSDYDRPINGTKTFVAPTRINGNIEVNGLINGHDFPRDIITATTDQTLPGVWHFNAPVEIDFTANVGQINDIDMYSIVHTNNPAPLAGGKRFVNDFIVEGNLVVPSIDGISVTELMRRALTKSGNQTIFAPKTIIRDVTAKRDVHIIGTINGLRLPVMEQTIFQTDKPKYIIGHKIFADDVVINGSLTTSGRIRGYTFPDDFVLKNTTCTVTGKKTFLNGVTVAENVFVDGLVDGIQLNDVVTLNTDQTIPDLKIFRGGLTFANLNVNGYIDGVTVDYIKTLASPNQVPVSNPTEFDIINATSLSNIKTINGYFVESLLKDSVLKGEKDVTFKSGKTFYDGVQIKNHVNVNNVNGLNLGTDLLTVNTPQRITGVKRFKNIHFKNSVKLNGLLNGLNLTRFQQSVVTLSTHQVITSNKTFIDSVHVDGATFVGKLDGVSIPDDIVLKRNQPKVIPVYAPKTFINGLMAKTLLTPNLELNGRINNVNWKEFAFKRVTTSTDQNITVIPNFTQDLKFHKDLRLSGSVNSVNVEELWKDAMLKSKPQNVTGFKHVHGMLRASRVQTTKGINDVLLKELSVKVIPVSGDVNHHVNVPLVIDVANVERGITLKGKLGNYSLDHIVADAVMKNQPNPLISGTKMFDHPLAIDGSAKIVNINTIDTSTMFSRTMHQTITGFYELSSKVTITNDLKVTSGFVNGIHLVDFNNKIMKTEGSSVASSLVFEDGLEVQTNLDLTTINGNILGNIIKDSVSKYKPETVLSRKEFVKQLGVTKDIAVVGMTNEKDLSKFAENVVLIVGEQAVTNRTTFKSTCIYKRTLQIDGNLKVHDKINNLSLKQLTNSVVYLNKIQNVSGTKTFERVITESNVHVHSLNTLNIPQDIVLTKEAKRITGHKTFEGMVVNNLIHNGTVNGENLSALNADTLFKTGNQFIRGRKTFLKSSAFKAPVEIGGKTCGIKFRHQLVTLSSAQNITGQKQIRSINVKGDSTIDIINDYQLGPLSDLYNIQQTRYAEEHRFTGRTIFKILPTIKLQIPHDVTKLYDGQVSQLDTNNELLKSSADQANRYCQSYAQLMPPLQRTAAKLVRLQYVRELNIKRSREFTTFVINNDFQYMVVAQHNTNCGMDKIFTKDQWDPFLSERGNLPMGKSTYFHPFTFNNFHYLLISDNGDACGSTSKLAKYNKTSSNFIEVCNLNVSLQFATTLMQGPNLYVITGDGRKNTSVLQLNIRNAGCELTEIVRTLPAALKVTLIPRTDVFALTEADGRSLSLIQFQDKTVNLFQRLQTDGIIDVVATTYYFKHYLIIARKYRFSPWVTDADTIQIYEFTPPYWQLFLKREIPSVPSRPLLQLQVFPFGPTDEPYLAILKQKTGITVVPLLGLETTENVQLPIALARKMHVFRLKRDIYVLVDKVNSGGEAHIYKVVVKGTPFSGSITCN